jgi:hypothetical protein
MNREDSLTTSPCHFSKKGYGADKRDFYKGGSMMWSRQLKTVDPPVLPLPGEPGVG